MGDPLQEITARVDAVDIGAQIGSAAHAAIPQLHRDDDPEMHNQAVLAATANVHSIIAGLLDGAPAATLPPPPASLKWTEWLVERGVDVSAIPWAYSFGQARLAEYLRETVASMELEAGAKLELGERLTRYVNAYVASVCAQMVEHFTAAEVLWRSDPGAARHVAVQEILSGTLTDPAGAARRLGYGVDGPQLAVMVWAADAPMASLRSTAESVLTACGAQEVLVVARGAQQVWAWGSGPALTDAPERPPSPGPGLFAALGGVANDLDGFVRTHADTTKARRMAELLGRRPGSLLRYRSIRLTSMIAADPAEALRFVDEELGALADDTDAMRRLRSTVTVYLEESMRASRTARRLGVHQNTVANRIQQAETAMGHPLTERRLEFEAALRLAEARDALRAAL